VLPPIFLNPAGPLAPVFFAKFGPSEFTSSGVRERMEVQRSVSREKLLDGIACGRRVALSLIRLLATFLLQEVTARK
jgi:hypothetical protein